MSLNLYSTLLTSITFGKASFNLADNPKFKLLFRPIISNKPFFVKCLSCLIISKHCLNIK